MRSSETSGSPRVFGTLDLTVPFRILCRYAVRGNDDDTATTASPYRDRPCRLAR